MVTNIQEVTKLWLADKVKYVKRSTYAAYALIVDKHILPAFGDMSIVEESNVQRFVFDKLQAGLSHKTIKDILVVFKMILKFGAKYNLCPYLQFDVKFPTVRESNEIEVLSQANHRKIMKYVQDNFTFKNLGIFICLSTGVRIGELCALTWDDIDISKGVIVVRRTIQRIYVSENGIKKTEIIIDTPKTATSMREIPLTKELQKIISPLKKIVNGDYYILTNESIPTEPRIYRNYYKKLMQKLNIPSLKFHGLRHSFATRCIESKCDYKTVSVILGHSNISTTLNLYVHPNMEQKKKCINQVAKLFK